MINRQQQIEDKAKEYIDYIESESKQSLNECTKKTLNLLFKYGADFAMSLLLPALEDATKWREVEKELPAEGKMVLIKYSCRCHELYAFGRGFESLGKFQWSMLSPYGNKGNITHWRPIESELAKLIITE